MPVRQDLYNVAIIAHVSHGRTTLVDAMLWQSDAFSERDTVEKTGERVIDSGDLRRKKGITILVENTAAHHSGPTAKTLGLGGGVTISVIDTPGHVDFGGEVKRGLSMADDAILMVNTFEGFLSQIRFMLCKALQAQSPVIVVVDKIGRPDSRIEEVVFEMTDLPLLLDEDLMNDGAEADVDSLLDVPVICASVKASVCSLENPDNDILPTESLEPLFEIILSRIPGPSYEEDTSLRVHATNLDASSFLGRLMLLCIHSGTLTKGASLGLARHDGTIVNVRVIELLRAEGLEQISTKSAGPGEIIAVAGTEDATIDKLLVDPGDPRPPLLITIDDPAISVTIGINTSPLVGRVRGAKVTAHQVKDRLDRGLVDNVSLRVFPIEHPGAWEVQGRGEPTPVILVEQMRREGFKPTVGKPQVVAKEIEDVHCEPMECMTIDILKGHFGAVTQFMVVHKGYMGTMPNHGSDRIRSEFTVPARGLIGFRIRSLTEARGTDIASPTAEGYAPWQGAAEQRLMGSPVTGRTDQVTPYAMTSLQERGSFIVGPSSEVYEGQVVGESPRDENMDVNTYRKEKQANVRPATVDVYELLTPSRKLTLEESFGFAANDECAEVTPDAVCIRKVILDAQKRFKVVAREQRAQR